MSPNFRPRFSRRAQSDCFPNVEPGGFVWKLGTPFHPRVFFIIFPVGILFLGDSSHQTSYIKILSFSFISRDSQTFIKISDLWSLFPTRVTRNLHSYPIKSQLFLQSNHRPQRSNQPWQPIATPSIPSPPWDDRSPEICSSAMEHGPLKKMTYLCWRCFQSHVKLI